MLKKSEQNKNIDAVKVDGPSEHLFALTYNTNYKILTIPKYMKTFKNQMRLVARCLIMFSRRYQQFSI